MLNLKTKQTKQKQMHRKRGQSDGYQSGESKRMSGTGEGECSQRYYSNFAR